MNLLITFIILNVANVIIQTVKSICTIKCGKTVAALVNAFAYGLYTVVIIYTNADIDLWTKVIVVAVANLVGVYVVKLLEEKKRKDMLWKVELTIPKKYTEPLHFDLTNGKIPHNYIENVGEWTIFNCYCATQKESVIMKKICDQYNAKYFVIETKVL